MHTLYCIDHAGIDMWTDGYPFGRYYSFESALNDILEFRKHLVDKIEHMFTLYPESIKERLIGFSDLDILRWYLENQEQMRTSYADISEEFQIDIVDKYELIDNYSIQVLPDYYDLDQALGSLEIYETFWEPLIFSIQTVKEFGFLKRFESAPYESEDTAQMHVQMNSIFKTLTTLDSLLEYMESLG